jgi:hypothetical protein
MLSTPTGDGPRHLHAIAVLDPTAVVLDKIGRTLTTHEGKN